MSAPASPAPIDPEANTRANRVAKVEPVQTPEKPAWKAWLLVAAIVAAPVAFGVYALSDPAAARFISIVIEYSNYLYLAATLLAAAAWISAKLFGED